MSKPCQTAGNHPARVRPTRVPVPGTAANAPGGAALMTNPDCENCTRGVEAIGPCPCGCGRWLCRRCIKGVKLNLASDARTTGG